jgi:KUP system potassium uptake protein
MALIIRALGGVGPFVFRSASIRRAMFYGSTLITPALSVLSAVEGLKIVDAGAGALHPAAGGVILVALFAVQSRGTASVSRASSDRSRRSGSSRDGGRGRHTDRRQSGRAARLQSGLRHRASLLDHGMIGLLTLGAVFLVVTGSEALYRPRSFRAQADSGGVASSCCRRWSSIIFGQGALVLANPKAIENPFFLLYPGMAALSVPMGLATAATVIASQAVITGSYSITQQAVQLGLLPRLEIRHTSASLAGQIYMPRVNWLLLFGVLLLVVLFRTSSGLASAYVLAVANAELMTALLGFIVIWKSWRWALPLAALVTVPFIAVDLVFVSASAMKILQGAWLPVVFGALVVLIMWTWRRGTRVLFDKTRVSRFRSPNWFTIWKSIRRRASPAPRCS